MKTLQILLLFVLLSCYAQAQITGGGEINNPSTTPKEEKTTESNELSPIKKYNGFFRVGRTTPSGIYGTPPSPDGFIYESFNGEDGLGVANGFSFELSSISYFNIPNVEQFGVGIQFGFGGTYSSVDWSNLDFWDDDDLDYILTAELYLGPTVAYNPFDKFVINASFLVAPSLFQSPTMDYSFSNSDGSYSRSLDIETQSLYFTQMGFQINVQYGALSLGLEILSGTAEYDYDIVEDTSIFDGFQWNYTNNTLSEEAVIDVRTTRLLLGVAF